MNRAFFKIFSNTLYSLFMVATHSGNFQVEENLREVLIFSKKFREVLKISRNNFALFKMRFNYIG